MKGSICLFLVALTCFEGLVVAGGSISEQMLKLDPVLFARGGLWRGRLTAGETFEKLKKITTSAANQRDAVNELIAVGEITESKCSLDYFLRLNELMRMYRSNVINILPYLDIKKKQQAAKCSETNGESHVEMMKQLDAMSTDVPQVPPVHGHLRPYEPQEEVLRALPPKVEEPTRPQFYLRDSDTLRAALPQAEHKFEPRIDVSTAAATRHAQLKAEEEQFGYKIPASGKTMSEQLLEVDPELFARGGLWQTRLNPRETLERLEGIKTNAANHLAVLDLIDVGKINRSKCHLDHFLRVNELMKAYRSNAINILPYLDAMKSEQAAYCYKEQGESFHGIMKQVNAMSKDVPLVPPVNTRSSQPETLHPSLAAQEDVPLYRPDVESRTTVIPEEKDSKGKFSLKGMLCGGKKSPVKC